MSSGYSRVTTIAIVFALMLFVSACNRQPDQATTAQPETAAQQEGAQQAATPAESPAPAAEQAPAQAAPQRSAARPSTRSAERPSAMARSAAPAAAATAPRPQPIVLEAGTVLKVRTTSALSSKTNAAGDVFEASLAEPVLSGGREALPRGAAVQGRVPTSMPAAGSRDSHALAGAHGHECPRQLGADCDQRRIEAGRDHEEKGRTKVGIGAGIGAAIGAIAGGGKGAAIGAATGGGAGTAAVLATRGDAAVVPAESVLTFELTKPATLPARD